jgi:hypothetical protein
MTFVVAERTIPGPFTAADIRDGIRSSAWCSELYGLTHCGSLLAPEIDRVVCIYRAPDAEAVRSASHRMQTPYDRVWSATLHGPAGPEPVTLPGVADMSPEHRAIVVQRAFDAPVAFADLESREEEQAWCFDAYGVRFLQSLFSADRRRMLCVYVAPDAEAVRQVQRQADMPFEQIWPATLCSV